MAPTKKEESYMSTVLGPVLRIAKKGKLSLMTTLRCLLGWKMLENDYRALENTRSRRYLYPSSTSQLTSIGLQILTYSPSKTPLPEPRTQSKNYPTNHEYTARGVSPSLSLFDLLHLSTCICGGLAESKTGLNVDRCPRDGRQGVAGQGRCHWCARAGSSSRDCPRILSQLILVP
jgi:hypothetical protein